MILFRSIFTELVLPFFITFGVMSFMLLMQHIYRLANLMVEKRFAAADLGLMLFYLLPDIFTITIPLGVVGAVFITVIRQSTDSELICMRTTGKSLWQYSIPFLAFGLITSLTSLMITLILQPSGYKKYSELQVKMVKEHADENIIPGKFNFDFGEKVIQIGGRLPTNEVTDIFIADRRFSPSSGIITASKGLIEIDEETKQVFFRLQKGTVYLPNMNQSMFSTVEFSNLNFLLELEPQGSVSFNRMRRTSTNDLLQTLNSTDENSRKYRSAIMEISYRLSVPWSCLVFVIAAIPMAIVDPRSGKSGSFLRAVFLVLTYYIIWIGFKDMVQTGNAPVWVLWLPLLLILCFGTFRLWQINTDIRLFSFLKKD